MGTSRNTWRLVCRSSASDCRYKFQRLFYARPGVKKRMPDMALGYHTTDHSMPYQVSFFDTISGVENFADFMPVINYQHSANGASYQFCCRSAFMWHDRCGKLSRHETRLLYVGKWLQAEWLRFIPMWYQSWRLLSLSLMPCLTSSRSRIDVLPLACPTLAFECSHVISFTNNRQACAFIPHNNISSEIGTFSSMEGSRF